VPGLISESFGVGPGCPVAIGAIAAVVAALLDYGYWALVVLQIFPLLVRTFGVFIASRWLPSAALSWASLRPLMHFNLHTVALRVLRAMIASLPRVLIGAVLGATALGVFDVARRLFTRISVLLMRPLNSVTLPVASELQNDTDGLRQWHRFSSLLITTLAYPLYIGTAAILPAAVPLIFGEQWLDAILPMQLVMLIGIRNATSVFNADILRGRGKPELTTRVIVASLCTSLVLLPLAVSWGVSLVVCAMVVASIASWLLGTYYVDRELGTGIARQFTIGWQSLISGIAMFIVITLVHKQFAGSLPPSLMVPLLLTLGVLTHLFSLWLLQREMTAQIRVVAVAILSRDRAALRSLMQRSSI